jgi:hypothetical protein
VAPADTVKRLDVDKTHFEPNGVRPRIESGYWTLSELDSGSVPIVTQTTVPAGTSKSVSVGGYHLRHSHRRRRRLLGQK